MRKVYMLGLASLFLFTVITGCLQPADQEASSAAKPPETRPAAPATPPKPEPIQEAKPVTAPSTLPPTPPAVKPQEAEQPKLTKELLINGDFSQWEDEKPVGWYGTKIEMVPGALGGRAVGLLEHDDWNVFGQWIRESLSPGKKVRVTARVKADNPDMALLKLVWKDKDTDAEHAEYAGQKKAGEFTELVLDFTVPDNFKGPLIVQVLRKPNVTGEVLVEKVSAMTTE